MYSVGTTVELTRDPPYSDLKAGDIGVVKDIFGNYYYVQFNSNDSKLKERFYAEGFVDHNAYNEFYYNGDRIKIVTDRSKYKGYYGTVYGYELYDNLKLFIDGTKYQYYDKYKYNYLKIKETSVQLVKRQNEREEKVMAKLTGYKRVAGGKMGCVTYYFALYDEDINVGDTVLVSGVCKEAVVVSEIITAEEAKEKTTKTIIEEVKCKVDLSAYEERVQNRKKAEELRKKMDQKIAEMDEMNKMEKMNKMDEMNEGDGMNRDGLISHIDFLVRLCLYDPAHAEPLSTAIIYGDALHHASYCPCWHP